LNLQIGKKKQMYILTYKTYLEEKIYKIIVFIWNDRPVYTTGSIGWPIGPKNW
jgi:hypothetical protein